MTPTRPCFRRSASVRVRKERKWIRIPQKGKTVVTRSSGCHSWWTDESYKWVTDPREVSRTPFTTVRTLRGKSFDPRRDRIHSRSLQWSLGSGSLPLRFSSEKRDGVTLTRPWVRCSVSEEVIKERKEFIFLGEGNRWLRPLHDLVGTSVVPWPRVGSRRRSWRPMPSINTFWVPYKPVSPYLRRF